MTSHDLFEGLSAAISRLQRDQQRWLSEFRLTPHVTSLVNYVHFAEDLARCVGCELQVDPRKESELYRRCVEGPLWAVQYRLRGPGADSEEARRILLEKAPLPYRSSRFLRWLYLALLWLRKVLPVSVEAKPRPI